MWGSGGGGGKGGRLGVRERNNGDWGMVGRIRDSTRTDAAGEQDEELLSSNSLAMAMQLLCFRVCAVQAVRCRQ